MSDVAVPAFHTSVQLKDTTSNVGHRPVRVHAWNTDGEPLILHEGRLIRATDHEGFLSVNQRKWAAENEQYVTAAPGWRVRVERPDGQVEIVPVALWHVCGPMDIRPVIQRPNGDARLYDALAASRPGNNPFNTDDVTILSPGDTE